LQRRPHRVLLISSFAERGRGGQESLFHLATALGRTRFRPSVLVPAEGSLARSLRANGVGVRVLHLPGVKTGRFHEVRSALWQLGSLIDELGIDLLHADGPRNTFFAGIIGRLKRKPIVWHVRASSRDPFDPLLSCLCSRMVLVADALRARFPYCRSRNKIHVIHNGVDLDRFSPSTPASHSGGPELIIGTTARVESQKGILELLQALRQLNGNVQSVRLRVAGPVTDAKYFTQCREYCRVEGIGEKVDFIGHVHTVEEFLRAIDVFALSSIEAEAFPRAVLEAMACGKPVVVADTGGTREAVEEGRTGFVVPPRAPTALSARLRTLLENSDLRDRMGRCGRRRAEALFGLDRNTERTVRVYEEVLACR
jgi:glycosyltransferase involved in cell wall biosynthesis